MASACAVLARFILLAGDAVVREGDTVVQGQIMVRGRAGPSTGDRPVNARALVQGRVWRAGQARIPLTIEQRLRTGRTADQYVLRLARTQLRLGRAGRFEAYDSEQFSTTLAVGRDVAVL